VTDLQQVRNALAGDSGTQVSWAFALAVHSFTRWPVDAFAVERDQNGRLRTVCWIQGNALGQLTADGDDDSPTINGAVLSIAKIDAVQLAGACPESRGTWVTIHGEL
jgi:hypothetical protein